MSDTLISVLMQFSKYFHKIIKANLTEDTYTFLRNEKAMEGDLTAPVVEGQGFAKLWDSYYRGAMVLADDRADFNQYFELGHIREFFWKYHGRERYWLRFRRRVRGEYQPIRLEVIPAEDYRDDNQSVILLMQDLSGKMYEEKNYLEELLQCLSENYEAIYYVDFDRDTIKPYRISRVIDEHFGDFFRTGPSYEEAMTRYIKAMVSGKDQKEMLELAKPGNVRERLKGKRAYSHEYRVERDGTQRYFRYKISNAEGTGELHRAVVGFADVSAEKQGKLNYYKTTKKVLIVEDEETSRGILASILSEHYSVVEAENGVEALQILEKQYEDIAVVMTDLEMPKLDGYELISCMKDSPRYSDIPVVVITSSRLAETDRVGVEVRCLELGASDFLLKPYIADVVINRVKSLIRLRESTAMLNILEKDPLTGLYTKEFFFKKVEQYLADHAQENYIMWVSDIQGLKIINEKYGLEKGDEVLQAMAESGEKYFPGFLFGGRIEGDKFAALMREAQWEDTNALNAVVNANNDKIFPVPNVVIKHGVYHIDRTVNVTPQGMYDRATLALQKIKSQYGVYVAEYNDELRKDLLVKQMIVESADTALREGQFLVYYQPKHDFHTDQTCGAEGLVRWIHPELGFMNPALFIPLFEQNGFITKMDFNIWDQVCRTLKKWQAEGVPVVPVSINVSRRDFQTEDLAGKIMALVDGHGLDHSMIHIEVTESAYSDDPEKITETVKTLHDNGFVIELDDFGTGYSSMTALSNLDLDILKLDKSIIQNDIPGSEKNILEFSMQLAKMLKLKTVAEGVETREQMERISALGGDYIQGYYYSKPLPADEFAKYLMR